MPSDAFGVAAIQFSIEWVVTHPRLLASAHVQHDRPLPVFLRRFCDIVCTEQFPQFDYRALLKKPIEAIVANRHEPHLSAEYDIQRILIHETIPAANAVIHQLRRHSVTAHKPEIEQHHPGIEIRGLAESQPLQMALPAFEAFRVLDDGGIFVRYVGLPKFTKIPKNEYVAVKIYHPVDARQQFGNEEFEYRCRRYVADKAHAAAGDG